MGVMLNAMRGTGKRSKIITTRGSPPYDVLESKEQGFGWKNFEAEFCGSSSSEEETPVG